MSDKINIINFRCKHRHSALSHPNCYIRFLQEGTKSAPRLPKILVFDIETAPLKAFVFQKAIWKANVGNDQVISEWFMLAWSAKWLFDEETISERLTGKEAKNEDDYRLVEKLHRLFNEADIIIAHNGDSFDIPNMNTRFIVHDLKPTKPYQTIDTMLVAKRQFGFTHNSLNALGKLFGFEPKVDVDFELWKRSVDGDEAALKEMAIYNVEDVRLLEQVYLKLRPWIKSHPNIGLYTLSDGVVCPNCGSEKVEWVEGTYYYTQTSRYPVFVCECGAYGRSRKSDLSKEVKKSLAVGLAK